MLQRPKPISDLFAFLSQHHNINIEVQHGFITESLSPSRLEDRAILLMQKVLQTQSQPKLDPICNFLKEVTAAGAHRSFKAFRDFATESGKYELIDGLRRQDGWGPKTAALFVRNLGYIELEPTLKNKFWPDTSVLAGDNLRLPVDRVITAVFEALAPRLPEGPSATIAGINEYLHDRLCYRDQELLIWDDLWFWGFITQKNAKGGPREHGWNEAKYWAVPHAPKDALSIGRIKATSDKFLELVS
ncbi:hypothetical protein A6V36_05515 [Paraburkholderia ginsengiterrae]|uniref:HhH-GPD domain-containing protein n=1 Tax=Paraburkholderia ginsengiterrae TaxID=1462993 RepID=A0A1A9NF39_9BURK|nr:hypothetical protein [Paraburkholderia ginsengiterrae]OAJ58382.1 hypothetical protein A6V36_05515 [Paraburkholderia ginsengiterrae]OAJ65602.1 hypothetical protein A6V37_13535 [Paraburkholderia ginsengiterrae]